jgi:hypothetical protein
VSHRWILIPISEHKNRVILIGIGTSKRHNHDQVISLDCKLSISDHIHSISSHHQYCDTMYRITICDDGIPGSPVRPKPLAGGVDLPFTLSFCRNRTQLVINPIFSIALIRSSKRQQEIMFTSILLLHSFRNDPPNHVARDTCTMARNASEKIINEKF